MMQVMSSSIGSSARSMTPCKAPVRAAPFASASEPQKPEKSASKLEHSQPFFIMDWLDELVADQDINQLACMLRTPQKDSKKGEADHRDDDDDDDATSSYYYTNDVYNNCPLTPKSSNRKKSASCPSLASRNRSRSPVRPRSLFGGRIDETQPSSTSNQPFAGSDSDSTSTHRSKSASCLNSAQKKRQCRSPASMYRKSITLGNGWNAKGLQKAQKGLWREALACWDNALEIRVQLLGPHDTDVANTFNNRGIALGKLDDKQAALEALQQALEIRLYRWTHHQEDASAVQTDRDGGGYASSGSSTLRGSAVNKPSLPGQVISTLHNIANVHQQAGHLQQALEVFGQARELGSQAHDRSQHGLQLARICVAMGDVYCQAQQWIDARDAYQDALGLYLQDHRQLHDGGNPHQELMDLQRDIQELDEQCCFFETGRGLNASTSSSQVLCHQL